MFTKMRKQESEWVASKAVYTSWGDENAHHVQITCADSAHFRGDANEVQEAIELLLKTIVPDAPARKHLTVETDDFEVCFTVADSLLPITDTRAVGTHTIGSFIPMLEYRWCALRHADMVARKHGGYLTLRESNGHLAVTMHLMRIFMGRRLRAQTDQVVHQSA